MQMWTGSGATMKEEHQQDVSYHSAVYSRALWPLDMVYGTQSMTTVSWNLRQRNITTVPGSPVRNIFYLLCCIIYIVFIFSILNARKSAYSISRRVPFLHNNTMKQRFDPNHIMIRIKP